MTSPRTIRRPATRAGTVALVGLLLLFAGATAQAGWLFVLAAGVLGAVAASLLSRPRLGRARIERIVPARLRVGDEVAVRIRISNPGAGLPALRVEDAMGAFEPVALACRELGRGEEAVAETVRRARLRGVYEGGPVHLLTTAPLGLVRSRCTLEVHSAVTIVPRAVDLVGFPALGAAASSYQGAFQGARVGAGIDYIGVRDYRPGDALRAVHWRSVARTGRLIVREFEDEERARVALVISGPDAGDPPDSAFEALVSAAASIARLAATSGHQVDLVHPDAHLWDADVLGGLEWLAGTRPADAPLVPLVERAVARTGRGGTVVLLAPTRGRAAADVGAAVSRARNASCRVVVVRALSSSWEPAGDEETSAPGVPVRTLVRGKDLGACLST